MLIREQRGPFSLSTSIKYLEVNAVMNMVTERGK